MLQDCSEKAPAGSDPAASIQAGAQESACSCGELRVIVVESAEKICSGGLGGAARGIMIFGTRPRRTKIVNGSTMSGEDKQLAKDLIIDFRTDPLSSLRQDVYRVMPVKSVSDVRQELEDVICEEVRGKVAQPHPVPVPGGRWRRGGYCSHGGSALRSRTDGTFYERGQYSKASAGDNPWSQREPGSRGFSRGSARPRWRELKSGCAASRQRRISYLSVTAARRRGSHSKADGI